MGTITAGFNKDTGITGESTVDGYKGQVAAIGFRETIEVGLPTSGGGGGGKPKQSDFQLIRYRDSSSPKLAEACANADELGTVNITIFRTAQAGVVKFMEYVLGAVYVSRIEQETLDQEHLAFGPHLIGATRGMPTPGPVGLTSILAPVVNEAVSAGRLTVNPIDVSDNFTNQEIERVSLNANTVSWVYSVYEGAVYKSNVTGGYSIATGKEL